MVMKSRNSSASWVALLSALLAFGACKLDIDAPSIVTADQLDSPANASLIIAGVQADFECSLVHYIVSTGLFGSELAVGSVSQFVKEVDKRDVSPVSSQYTSLTCNDPLGFAPAGLYKPLASARWLADHALKLLEGWTDAEVPNRQQLIATAAAYGGYSLLLMGEGMCSSAIDVGPELTPAQLFAEAEARFTKGIAAAQSANNGDLRNWNLVGRARARHRQGNLADASADAAQVPLSFVKTATYSAESPRRENLVWVQGIRNRFVVVDPSYRALTFGGVPDPRVPVTDAGINAADAVTRLWTTSKYASNAAPIVFASGVEAALIEAEAAGGQTAVNTINLLHARVGLPPFSSSDEAAIRDQIIEERRREFFLDGHHLGDARQYNVPLLPLAGTPIPAAYGSGVYGAGTCFPLPEVERANNPNITKR